MNDVPASASLSATAPGRYRLTGDLTFASVPQLWPQGRSLFATPGGVELDLSAVAGADSAGLALLVAWQAAARAAGAQLRYTAVPDRLLAIARISEADSLLAG